MLEQAKAVKFFSIFYNGEHHIPSELKRWGQGWEVRHKGELSTYDFNTLTCLVLLAHDLALRVGIMPASPGSIRIVVWERSREGGLTESHPELQAHIEKIRSLYQQKPLYNELLQEIPLTPSTEF